MFPKDIINVYANQNFYLRYITKFFSKFEVA